MYTSMHATSAEYTKILYIPGNMYNKIQAKTKSIQGTVALLLFLPLDSVMLVCVM